jgi:TonB family protein
LYLDAKATFDRKDYVGAIDKFERVRQLSAHPDAKGDADLADLVAVADGFLELTRAALPNSASSADPAPAPAPASTPDTPANPTPRATPSSGKPPELTALTPPIAIRQDLPPWTPTVAGTQLTVELRGSIEVEIDAAGAVTSARMVQPVHVAYDKLLLEAARNWRYEPARRGSDSIPATKRVDVVLRPREER